MAGRVAQPVPVLLLVVVTLHLPVVMATTTSLAPSLTSLESHSPGGLEPSTLPAGAASWTTFEVSTSSAGAGVDSSVMDSVNVTATPPLSDIATTDVATMTMKATDSVATIIPSSAIILASSSITTPPGPTTTTTRRPTTTKALNQIKCGGKWVPTGVDSSMWVVRPGVIQYACRDGFRENGTGVSLIECRGNRWTSMTPLECVPIQPEVEPPAGVPGWIPVLVMVLVVILLLALLFLLALAVYICRGNHFTGAQSSQPSPKPAPKKGSKTNRRWPWKRPPPRPLGHIGPDGVAWTLGSDHTVLPVKRRF